MATNIFSGMQLPKPTATYNPAAAPNATKSLTGNTTGFAPALSNYYAAPNPAFSPPGNNASQLTIPTSSLSSNGVKANAPGNKTQGIVNSIKSTYTAPKSAQTTTSNQGTLPNNNVNPNPIPTPQPAPTFGGIVGSLVNQQNSPYNTSAQGAIAGIQGGAQSTYGQGFGTAANAGDLAQQKIQELSQLQQNAAAGLAGIKGEAIPLQFQQGRQQALQQMYGGQEQALATEIAGLGGLYGTGAGQQATGLNALGTSGNIALTGQGQAQNALQAGAGFAQPQLGSIGQVPFSPLTQNQGSALGTQQYGSLPAAGQALGAFTGAQQLGAAPYAAQASNIQAAGTATTGAANTAYQQYYNQSLQTNTALNQVQSLGNLALQTAEGGNINPFQVAAGNMTLAQFKRQLSSPSQATFDQTMATFQGALSQLLSGSSDVTPTQLSQWSTAIANGSMPVATLQAIYNQGIKEGTLKLQNINAAGAAAYGQLQSQAPGGGGSSNIGSSWEF